MCCGYWYNPNEPVSSPPIHISDGPGDLFCGVPKQREEWVTGRAAALAYEASQPGWVCVTCLERSA